MINSAHKNLVDILSYNGLDIQLNWQRFFRLNDALRRLKGVLESCQAVLYPLEVSRYIATVDQFDLLFVFLVNFVFFAKIEFF